MHPGYLVDDPEGYHAGAAVGSAGLRTSWICGWLGGRSGFRDDRTAQRALLTVAQSNELTRTCLVLLGEILEAPELMPTAGWKFCGAAGDDGRPRKTAGRAECSMRLRLRSGVTRKRAVNAVKAEYSAILRFARGDGIWGCWEGFYFACFIAGLTAEHGFADLAGWVISAGIDRRWPHVPGVGHCATWGCAPVPGRRGRGRGRTCFGERVGDGAAALECVFDAWCFCAGLAAAGYLLTRLRDAGGGGWCLCWRRTVRGGWGAR